MSLLTTVPEELAAAAAQLTAIVSSLTAQNAGAAAATTGVAPAAADSVSLQQAGIFSAYGTLYQQLASEAQAIQEQFANTLGLSSGTYSATEASNAAQAGGGLNTLYGFLSNSSSLFSPSGGPTTIALVEGGNFASAQSDDLGLITGTLSAVTAPSDAAGDLTGLAGAADLAGTTGPAVPGLGGMAGMAGLGAMPMTGGMGGATMVGKLSVPPSWAGTVTTVSSVSPMGLQTGGWTAAAPQAGTGTIIPGMPGVGAAARNSAGFGAPRYGVKPLVMPKPTAV